MIPAYLEITKPKSVLLLAFVGFAAGVIGSGSRLFPLSGPLALATAAVVLGSMGANTITSCIDRDIDTVMLRTRNRPLPTGRISSRHALWFGLLLVLAAFVLLLANGFVYSAFWAGIGFGTIILYNAFLKRRTPLNILIAAPAGGVPVLAVWSAVTGEFISALPALLAVLIVVWTPVHVWSLALGTRNDYRLAGIPMMPVVTGIAPAARRIALASILLAGFCGLLFASAGNVPLNILVPMAGLNAGLLVLGYRVVRDPSETRAKQLFWYTSPYLFLVFLLLAVGVPGP